MSASVDDLLARVDIHQVITIISPLSPEECLKRLRGGADRPSILQGGDKVVVGKVRGNIFKARKKLSTLARNSFQPWLTAKVRAEGHGAAIDCTFSFHPLVVGFIAVWMAIVLWITGDSAVYGISHDDWSGVLMSSGMIGFAGIITCGGWWIASGDREYLLAFVRRRTRGDGGLVLSGV